MARDPEQVRLKVVEEGQKPESGEVVRLNPNDSTTARQSSQSPARPQPKVEAPAERLSVAPRTEERRTHEPSIDALIDVIAPDRALEENWSNEARTRQPLPWGWFVLFGLLVSGAVVWSLMNRPPNPEAAQSTQNQSVATVENDARENAEAEARVDRILKTAHLFAFADTIEKIIPLIRYPERVTPLLAPWYAEHPLKADPFVSLEMLQPTYDQRGSFWIVRFSTKGGNHQTLMVEELSDQKVAVDWESAVAYQPLDWTHYALTRPPGSFDFRVRISPDNLYSHEFTDTNRWMSFKLTAQNSEETLFGYADRKSGLADEIVTAFQKNGYQPTGMILRLSVPSGLNSPRGVVIEQIRSPHPVYLAAPGP